MQSDTSSAVAVAAVVDDNVDDDDDDAIDILDEAIIRIGVGRKYLLDV